ncbi:MAG: hypothetical protein EXS64_01925 [Candidatus Latescibacteria bacterium]|nr:hypothetical protein [Candidatus Latescibacterota bacterium]
MIFKISVRVDLGRDLGQNFGSLFEATDSQGRVIAGAGFLGAFNTESRSDRRVLNFFIKPGKQPETQVERLPRANDDGGVYLHAFDDKTFARSRGGKDPHLRVWDPKARNWVIDEATLPLSIHVGDGVLTSTSGRVTYRDRTLLELGPDQGILGETYYANGCFILHQRFPDSTPKIDRLVACPWTPDGPSKIDLAQGRVQEMDASHPMVVYAYGQLGQDILAATNTGGVYAFDGERWRILYERPDKNVSFQVYSMINYYDRLLLGQYPTGELYEFDGKELILHKGWPPVMPGVSGRAREAQTTAIYGGDLYVGVWPWAEVWRYDGADWSLAHRMFTHPELTDAVTHPYEAECTKLEIVLNQWGQRVTSMIPSGDALYVSTSAKGSAPYEPRFGFLTDEQQKDYGAIYRLARPGHLSVHTDWKAGPTTFEWTITQDQMRVSQDGRLLGSAPVSPDLTERLALKEISWGKGVYGGFRGEIVEKTIQREEK